MTFQPAVTSAVSGSTRPFLRSQPMRRQEGRPSGVTATPKPRASKTSECVVDVSAQSRCVSVRSVTVCVCVAQTVCGGAVGEQLLRQQRGSVRGVRRRQERGGAVFTAVHHERHTGRGAAQDQKRGRLHDQHLPRHAEVNTHAISADNPYRKLFDAY